MTTEERQAIDKVLRTDDAVEAYKSTIVDPVKNRSKPEATTQDLIDFASAYLSIGVRYPLDYARSIAGVSAPLLAPGRGITYYATPEPEGNWFSTLHNTRNSEGLHLTFYKPGRIEVVSTKIKDFYDSQFDNRSLKAFPFSRGLYGGWIPLICILLSACNNRKNWIVFMPIVLSVLVLVISPAASARYVLPLLYTTPLMLGLLCHSFLRSKEPGLDLGKKVKQK